MPRPAEAREDTRGGDRPDRIEVHERVHVAHDDLVLVGPINLEAEAENSEDLQKSDGEAHLHLQRICVALLDPRRHLGRPPRELAGVNRLGGCEPFRARALRFVAGCAIAVGLLPLLQHRAHLPRGGDGDGDGDDGDDDDDTAVLRPGPPRCTARRSHCRCSTPPRTPHTAARGGLCGSPRLRRPPAPSSSGRCHTGGSGRRPSTTGSAATSRRRAGGPRARTRCHRRRSWRR